MAAPMEAAANVPHACRLEEVVELVRSSPKALFARVSHGPEHDRGITSTDYETGLALPGLSVHPLSPPAWYQDRPLVDWVARQLTAYAHLRGGDRGRHLWILTGREVDRGPDNEPLVADHECVMTVDDEVVARACDHHARHRSSRPEDRH